MNDKEYLQEIKNDVFKQIDYSLSQGEVCDYISLEEEKVNWLIEQAGKVEQLQQGNENLKRHVVENMCPISNLEFISEQLQQAQEKINRLEERALFNDEELEVIRELLSAMSCGYERETWYFGCCEANPIIEKIDAYFAKRKEVDN
jgi:hypothetical protein